jgi:hypothetical protein
VVLLGEMTLQAKWAGFGVDGCDICVGMGLEGVRTKSWFGRNRGVSSQNSWESGKV